MQNVGWAGVMRMLIWGKSDLIQQLKISVILGQCALSCIDFNFQKKVG